MTATEELCTSRMIDSDAGLLTCLRFVGHEGLHVGLAESGERMQWTKEQAMRELTVEPTADAEGVYINDVQHAEPVEDDEHDMMAELAARLPDSGQLVAVDFIGGFTREGFYDSMMFSANTSPFAVTFHDQETGKRELVPYHVVQAIRW